MYGDKIENQPSDMLWPPLRSLIASPDTAPNGNLVLRVGSEVEQGPKWERTAHVVMTPEEGRDFACEILRVLDFGDPFMRWTITLGKDNDERAIDVLAANSAEHNNFMYDLIGQREAYGETTNQIPASWKDSR